MVRGHSSAGQSAIWLYFIGAIQQADKEAVMAVYGTPFETRARFGEWAMMLQMGAITHKQFDYVSRLKDKSNVKIADSGSLYVMEWNRLAIIDRGGRCTYEEDRKDKVFTIHGRTYRRMK
jgi:hypothetical protein